MNKGDKLWIVDRSYRGSPSEPKEVTVSKVGRKYFELEGYSREKFEIDNLRQVSQFNYQSQCYYSLQEILDEREMSSIREKLRTFFSGYGKINLSLEQLRKINEIISHE